MHLLRARNRAGSMTEHISVRVPALMYRALYAHAQRRRMDVGELMAELAIAQLYARAMQPPTEPTPRQRTGSGSHLTAAEISTPASRLSAAQVEQLQHLLAARVPYREIASRMHVGLSTVSRYAGRIKKGEL